MLLRKKRLARELLTMTKMVEIYCSAQHGSFSKVLCTECEEFLSYAGMRLEKCPYGDEKPTCANCPIHCYKQARKDQVRIIMGYSGPRMMLRHPLLAIAHKLDGLRQVQHPRDLTRTHRLRGRKRRIRAD